MRVRESDCMTPEKPLTTGKVAELLQVTPTTVRSMCERGELRGAVRIGDWWRIPRSALEPYLPQEEVSA